MINNKYILICVKHRDRLTNWVERNIIFKSHAAPLHVLIARASHRHHHRSRTYRKRLSVFCSYRRIKEKKVYESY